MLSNSGAMVVVFPAGTIRYVSSAYLNSLLSLLTALRSLASIIKAGGPMAEPCMTEALIGKYDYVTPLDLVQCCRPVMKFNNQLKTLSSIGQGANLASRVECLTVSNALLKSKPITCTYL